MKRLPHSEETRTRILHAAGEAFGRRGFEGTTIRQITRKARVNVAAVNYHFKDKQALYIEVLREARGRMHHYPKVLLGGDPSDRLRALIRHYVRRMLDPQRPAWHMQVISLEMLRPTPALDVLVRELTSPVFRQLRALVSEVTEAHLPRVKLDMLTASIIGQCLFYVRSRPMIERVAPEMIRGDDHVERIAGHISEFTLAALQQLYPATKKVHRAPAALSA